jgi:DNA recombination protein RmuC
MEYIVVILLVVLVIGFAVALFLLSQKLKDLKNSSAVDFLKTDVVELSRTMQQLQQAIGEKLDRSSTDMQSSMQKQLSESAKLVSDVTQRLAKLDETNRRVVDVADELKTLQNVF